MQLYYFKISDVVIKITTPYKIIMEEAYEGYIIEEKIGEPDQKIDIQVDFVSEEGPIIPSGDILYDSTILVTNGENGLCIYHHDEGVEDYFSQMKVMEDHRYQVSVQEKEWWRFHYISQLFEYMDIEYILNRQHIMLLHSSHIMWHGKSILFTAPSGTGKSTQADLWNRYEHAEIINGDRTAIRCHDGEIYAYGIPYAGSSCIFKNKAAEIGAIVVLRQAAENTIRMLKKSEAFRLIYSECTVQGWDSVYINNLCDILEKTVRGVPVYLLSCRPDQEAVDLLRKELEIC